MKIPRTLCKLLLLSVSASATAQTAISSVWHTVPTRYQAPELQAASLTDAQLASVRARLLARKTGAGMWECKDDSWLADLSFFRLPVASHPVFLVEAGKGCARGGQGANGAMWLFEQSGDRLRLIATPDREFNGWLYSIQPETHHGFHDLVLGWHMSAAEASLSYFRFDGTVYRAIARATLESGESSDGTIIADPPR